jgi:hypothetical protein
MPPWGESTRVPGLLGVMTLIGAAASAGVGSGTAASTTITGSFVVGGVVDRAPHALIKNAIVIPVTRVVLGISLSMKNSTAWSLSPRIVLMANAPDGQTALPVFSSMNESASWEVVWRSAL